MSGMARRLALGALALGALILLLEWVVPDSETPHVAAGLRLARSTSRTPLAERAVAAWENVILARPLFTVSRRPPKVAASGGSAPVDAARLSGIMIGTFGRRAIFAPQGGGKPLVLGENAAVNESTIKSIEPNRVTLANGTVLLPSFDKNRVPVAYTPPPFQPVMVPGQTSVVNGMPQPAFPMPRFVPPPQQQQQPQPENEPNDGQPPPMPVFRGQAIPNRRE